MVLAVFLQSFDSADGTGWTQLVKGVSFAEDLAACAALAGWVQSCDVARFADGVLTPTAWMLHDVVACQADAARRRLVECHGSDRFGKQCYSFEPQGRFGHLAPHWRLCWSSFQYWTSLADFTVIRIFALCV